MTCLVERFVNDSSGATVLEYGIMAGLIAGVLIATVTQIGANMNGIFGTINTALGGVPGV